MDRQVKIAFLIIVLVRFLQIFVDYAYDWPDEYWQGPQIAYKIANGYGFDTWEWTMSQPLRNSIYQMYLSLAYTIGNSLNLSAGMKEATLKLFQIFIAVLTDWFLLKIGCKYTKKVNFLSSILILTNWFYFSMMNRTYINSIETCLTVVAYYFWLTRSESKGHDFLSRVIVALCFIIRTTSIILWAVIWPIELFTTSANKIKFLLKNILQIILMIFASVVFNSLWYGQLTFVQLNFFKYNIILKWSELYGVSSFFFYFYQTIPYILGGFLLPILLSCYSLFRKQEKTHKQSADEEGKQIFEQLKKDNNLKQLFFIIILALVVLSLSTHKQSRFLLVISPFLLILSLKGFSKLQNKGFILFLIVTINIFLFFTCAVYGKSGGVKILRDLRSDIQINHEKNTEDIALIYLCEPHSLPLFSIIQKNITVRLLDTSPLRKLQHFNQQVELMNNAETLFSQLTQGLSHKTILYVIIQEKYSVLNNYFNEQYQFLMANNFTLLKSQKNVNMWEKHWDGFVLLKKS